MTSQTEFLESQLEILLKRKILEGRIDLLTSEVLGYKLQDFHLKILRFALKLYQNQADGLLLAPRGFGKSTIGNVVLCVWLILINPNIRILISSSTQHKAEAFLREIKTHFEQNEKLRSLFGNKFRSDAWKNAEIFVQDRTKIAKEATLSAHGQSGAVVSKHYDVHIVDDSVNEDNARTKGQREKLKDWFYMSLDPTLEPDGFRLIIGTRYHPDDLYGTMIEQAKSKLVDDEISQESERTRKEFQYMVLEAVVDEGTERERSLWEEKYPLWKLKKKRRNMGIIRFNAQFQNRTDLMKGKIIKESMFEYYSRDSLSVNGLRIFQGVDLGTGKGSTNDFFALVTKGYDKDGKAYTLDVVHGRYSFHEQMVLVLWKAGRTLPEIKQILRVPDMQIKDVMTLFQGQNKFSKRQYRKVIRIGIESVIYQRVLPDTLKQYDLTLPVVRIDQSLDKETRMMKYSPRFENGMEFFPEDDSVDSLKEEMLLFPDGENDDMVDAHEICHRVAAQVLDYGDDDNEENVEVRVIG